MTPSRLSSPLVSLRDKAAQLRRLELLPVSPDRTDQLEQVSIELQRACSRVWLSKPEANVCEVLAQAFRGSVTVEEVVAAQTLSQAVEPSPWFTCEVGIDHFEFRDRK